jgi:hypothetical protein
MSDSCFLLEYYSRTFTDQNSHNSSSEGEAGEENRDRNGHAYIVARHGLHGSTWIRPVWILFPDTKRFNDHEELNMHELLPSWLGGRPQLH